MWRDESRQTGGFAKFFRLAMARDTLEEYYNINFALMQHHHYSLTDLENMLPWERDIYVSLLIQYVEEENNRIKEIQNKRK
mgnify:CR=1 FL=1